jgi:hypothetical protein
VSPNPKVFKKEWIEETVSSLSARHSRASEVSPARSFVEAVFLAKNCRGRYKKIEGLATPPFSEWRGGQPLRWRDFTRERYRHQFSRNPLLMQSSLCRQIYQKAKKIPLSMLVSAIESPFSL